MTARNDITGDSIQTKGTSEAYRSGWDRIFGQKPKDVLTTQDVQAIINGGTDPENATFHLRSYGDVTEEELLRLTQPKV